MIRIRAQSRAPELHDVRNSGMDPRKKLDINFLLNSTSASASSASVASSSHQRRSGSEERETPTSYPLFSPAGRKSVSDGDIPAQRFPCDQCELVFRWPGNLKKHTVAVHDKLREHKCTQCSKTFTFRDGLTRHIAQVHDNIRRFKCDLCPAKFKQLTHLQTHMRTIHQK